MTAKETQVFDDAHNINSDWLNTPICQYNVSKAYVIYLWQISINKYHHKTNCRSHILISKNNRDLYMKHILSLKLCQCGYAVKKS